MLRTISNYIPKFIQVKEKIKRDLVVLGLKPGDRIPTDREFEKRHSAANVTIRKALDELIAEGVISRKFNTRARLVRIPRLNNAENALLSTKKARIVLVYAHPDKTVSPLDPIANLLDGMCREIDYSPRIASIPDVPEGTRYLQEILSSGPIDGLLALGIYSEKSAQAIADTSIPAVLIDYSPRSCSLDSVTTDNRNIALRAMTHLLKLGHSNIDFIGHMARKQRDLDSLEIEYHWQAMLNENAGTGRSHTVSSNTESAAAITEEILSARNKPSALFISNPDIAVLIKMQLKHRMINVPEDISIITVGGISLEHDTKMTAVHVNWYELARLAVRRLGDTLDGMSQPGVRLTHAGGVVDRGTTRAI